MITRYAIVLLLVCVSGCAATYVTPAGGVSLADATDEDLLVYYDRQPVSPFPANVAVVRVQDSDFYAYHARRGERGRYGFVTVRDIEDDNAVEKMSELPLVNAVAPVGRLMLPANANSLDNLRVPAAQLRSDMLLVYTLDTTFTVDGKALGPLSLISLGLLRNQKAHVTATVSSVLVDVRSGFIYGSAEATAVEEQSASIWSTQLAIDSARKLAEERAFASFVDEFSGLWTGVINVHAATR